MKRQVKTGYARDPAAILGTRSNVIEFAMETKPGIAVAFNQHMAGWAKMRIPITFIAHECENPDCPWKYHGTIDGSVVYRFLEEWIEIIAEGEVEEDDLRVRKLVEDMKDKGNPFLKLLGGGAE